MVPNARLDALAKQVGDGRGGRRHQATREPRPFPILKIKRRPPTLFDYRINDFETDSYNPHPAISAPIAV